MMSRAPTGVWADLPFARIRACDAQGIRTRRPHGFCSAAENENIDRRSMSCRCSILHRSSQCPQRGIRLRHKCLEYVLRPSMTEEWRALSRKEWHHLDAVAQQRRSAKGSEQS